MRRRIARHETRSYDWDALKFQADYDPKYRRAQLRYIGTGGTGVAPDDNSVPAEHFTFSTMLLPAHCEGPLHIHTDVEEVFFMMRGTIRLFFEKDGETLGDRARRARSVLRAGRRLSRLAQRERGGRADVRHAGRGEADDPTYPPDHPLSKIKRK